MSPEDQKAKLCEKISQAIGTPIPIARLVRVTGQDLSYSMELADDTKIDVTTVKQSPFSSKGTAGFTPRRIVAAHFADQFSHVFGYRRPAKLAATQVQNSRKPRWAKQ